MAALLITGCGVEIPAGYRPSQSALPNASITEIAIDQRTEPIEISGPGLNGGTITTEDMSGIVIVNAWASWCPPCREEWPIFVEIQNEFPEVNLLGLNEADDKATIEKLRTEILDALKVAEKVAKPGIEHLISDVYAEPIPALQQQLDELKAHIRKYPDAYPVTAGRLD